LTSFITRFFLAYTTFPFVLLELGVSLSITMMFAVDLLIRYVFYC